jgi:hypothetical protein
MPSAVPPTRASRLQQLKQILGLINAHDVKRFIVKLWNSTEKIIQDQEKKLLNAEQELAELKQVLQETREELAFMQENWIPKTS